MDRRGPGDPGDAAMEQLLHHTEWLRRLAASLVVDAALADDVAQQTLLLALQRPPASDRHPRAWLATVARNVARTFARGEQRRESRERLAAVDVRLPATDDLVAQATLHHAVVGAVLAIEEPYRALLLRRWFEEKKPGALARELGVPVETVRTRLKRGLELVREELVRRRALPGGVVALVALLDETACAMAVKGIAAGGAIGGALLMATKAKFAAIAVSAVVVVASAWVVVDAQRDSEGASIESSLAEPAAEATGEGAVASQSGEPAVAAERRVADSAATSGSVVGSVVDERGEVVVGARLGWIAPDGPPDRRATRSLAPELVWAGATVVPSSAGTFELPWNAALADGRATLDLLALAPGYEPCLWQRARPGDRVVLRLRRGVDCFGTVRDLAGTPIGGATLRWCVHGDRQLSAMTTSDVEGRYRFDRSWPSPGQALADRGLMPSIDVIAEGFAPITLSPWENEVALDDRRWRIDVWMTKGATLRGHVVDLETGAPLEGADVWLRTTDPSRERALLRTRSCADGSFALEHVPAWGVTFVGGFSASPSSRRLGHLCALHLGRGMAQVALDVPDDGAELSFRLELPLAGGVRGRVVDPAGVPIADAFVFAVGRAGGQRGDRSQLDGSAPAVHRTGADGRYEIGSLALADGPSTTAPICARVESGEIESAASQTVSVPLVAGAFVEAPDLVVTPRRVLRVDVVDENGAPVPGAQLQRLGPKDGGFLVDGGSRTDAEGRCWFDLDELAAADGPRAVVVAADGFAWTRRELGRDEREIRIALEPERRLRGRVVDVDGRPGLASVAVVPVSEPAETFHRALESGEFNLLRNSALVPYAETRAGEGRFEVRRLGRGPWHVAAFRNGADGRIASIVMKADVVDSDGELELVLKGSGTRISTEPVAPDPTAVGTVELSLTFAATGRPVLRGAGSRLVAGGNSYQAQPIAPGRYTFDRVPPGRYELLAITPGAARQMRTVEVTAGSTTAVAVSIDEGIVARGRVVLAGVPEVKEWWLHFQSDDGGGSPGGKLEADGSFEFSGLVAGRSYLRWLAVMSKDEQVSHWVAAGPPLAAADAARAEPTEWLPANILSAGVRDRSMSVDAAHLRVRDANGVVVWEYGPFSWRTSPQRTLPIGTYQVELSIPGRTTETRTVELQQAERGVEVRFQLQQ